MIMGKLLLFMFVMVLVGVCGDSGKPCLDPDNPNELQCSNTTIEGKAGDTVILPCSTKDKKDISYDQVQWLFKDPTGGNKTVHECLGGKDYLQKQSDDFKNRTSLFKDQLSSGNCSLSLNVTTAHSGTYYSCVGGQLYCTVTLNVHPAGEDDSSQKHQEVTVSPDKPNNGTDGQTQNNWTIGCIFVGVVVVGVVGGVVAAAALIGLGIYCYRKHRNPQNEPVDQNPNEEQIPMNVVEHQGN